MENRDAKLLKRIFLYFDRKNYGWEVIWQTVGDAT
jgi:hypothetical protein